MVWDASKNQKLIQEGRPSFEQVVQATVEGKMLDLIENSSHRHQSQQVIIISVNEYTCAVPFEETQYYYILKTVFPSRKLHTIYGRKM